jgi:hypothetical protein
VARAACAAAAKAGIAHRCETPADSDPLSQMAAAKSNPGNLSIAGTVNRVEKMVRDADGALVITIGEFGRRMDMIHDLAENHRRPWLHIDFEKIPAFKASKVISDWLLKNRIETLFVIGAEDDVNPDIYEKTFHVLTSVCWLLQRTLRSSDLPVDLAANPAGDHRPAYPPPADVKEAVKLLIVEMPLKDRATVSNMTEKELYTLNFSLGSYIRNNFGIWSGNQPLLISCRNVSGNPNLPQKDASSVIIKELWKTLKETHKLRLIKT